MQFFSKILHRITPIIKKNIEEDPKYVNLAPTDKADKSRIYSSALNIATNDPNVSNIALTGPYGSGKSSIIKTYLTRYRINALEISLAAFFPEADAKGGNVSRQEIERSILQQMLYGADANSLPLSRFKRIQSPKWWSPIVSLCIIFGSFSCWHLIQKWSEILKGDFFLPFDSSNWFNLLSFALGFLFLWSALHHIYIKSFGVSLKSISLKDIEITPEVAEEESILNRHLDEIIYFFQSTKYDLVIIEDLDRFNNPDVFVTLREINSLINANEGVKRPIRFLYALRDNMFVNTDRTKFFEFIIPVIPIINSSNSIDKIIEEEGRLSLDGRLDRQYLREVSRYLDDLRLIKNIFNEYAIYVANLETDGESILDVNKLLAILIYKNVLPSDFEELHREKGNLAEILNRHDAYIAESEVNYKSQISELEQKISAAEKQIPSDIEELRKIYAMALISKLPQGYTTIKFNGYSNVPVNTLTEHKEFDQLMETEEIFCFTQQNRSQRVSLMGLQKEVKSNETYKERKEEIKYKTNEFRGNLSKIVQELRGKISTLRTAKFNEIIRMNTKGANELFDAFGENRELMRYLVLEGFLDDTYYQYTSLFHSGRLSPNDNKFLIQIRSFNNPEPDFQIDNPKEVIAAMRDEDFRQSFTLNKTLVDCMFSNHDDYGPQITKLLGFISSNFDECDTFFLAYYERGKRVTELTSTLLKKWPDFISAAIASPNNIIHVARMIAHLPEEQLKSLPQKNNNISDFISSNLSDILALGIDFDPDRLKLLQFETKNLRSIEPYTAIVRLLIAEGFYKISIENIEFIFRNVLGLAVMENLQNKHYSTVLKTENMALINKVQHDFDLYLKDVLLQSEDNTEEDVLAITKVINHDEVEIHYLEQFIERQSAKLPSLDQIPARLHSPMFRLQKIDASWGNCLAYIASENFDATTLTAFLHLDDTLSTLSSIAIDDGKPAFPLQGFVFNNNDLRDDIYQTYVQLLPNQFNKFPEGASLNKMRILVEENVIIFSEASFSFLDGEDDLQIQFIEKNIDGYFAIADRFETDDDFREKLLSSDISDNQKLKVIEGMDLTSLTDLTSLAEKIGKIFFRTGGELEHVSVDVAQAIISNAKSLTIQISLFNMCKEALSDMEVRAIIDSLPYPFSDITPGWRKPTIPNTKENLELVEWLKARFIISSWKPTEFNEIRIYNFRELR